MKTNVLAIAAALSDRDLLARLERLAAQERGASAELVAHLAALDTRAALYAASGYGSLFSYCTQALRLSEDAACNRIEAARACRRFPMILDLLASGDMSLTSVRLLGRHLTEENHQGVLARACRRSRHQVEAMVAELAPRPDVPTSVRKLPAQSAPPTTPSISAAAAIPASSPSPSVSAPLPALVVLTPRPVIQATAPERYRVQFTIGQQTHDELRELQALLRREIPDGDLGTIVAGCVTLMLERVKRTKLGATARPRSARVIRPRTDKTPASPSRHVPSAVQRTVWRRDGGQCAFVSQDGRKCTERTFLEFHHVQPYANAGPATVENISLRCWRHNQYEAELIFGPGGASSVGEDRARLARVFPERDAMNPSRAITET